METDLGKTSLFNEASLKMKRIDTHQTLVNNLRTNLLNWNPFYLKYNYQIVISEILSLAAEVRGKLSTDEKKDLVLWRDKIIDMQEQTQIYKTKSVETFSDTKNTKEVIWNNWRALRSMIFELEDFVRDLIEEHGLSSPNTEEEALWD